MKNIRPKMNCIPNVRHDDNGKCSSFWAVFVFSPGTGRIFSRNFWRNPIFPQGTNRALPFPRNPQVHVHGPNSKIPVVPIPSRRACSLAGAGPPPP
ncbi:hypothetical protein B4135_2561 [Caldibacillus debilis]|uniref:Uncharacterized protein n=1 Tax=Caldibacillus debilis TaxID=301148 RepID=A0A150LZL5_9BACI|nr:hypothetical protein B4135_2561 [Caldibacillus debilis]